MERMNLKAGMFLSLLSACQSVLRSWVFLFDKILLITARKYKFTKGTSYSVKDYHDIADITLVDPILSAKTKVEK